MGCYITHMTGVLLWLASVDNQNIDPDNSDAVYNTEIRRQIFAKLQDPTKANLTSSLLDKEFFRMLEEAYMEHLKPALLSFGRDSSFDDLDLDTRVAKVDDDDIIPKDETPHNLTILWDTAYEMYINDICKKLVPWRDTKIMHTADMAIKSAINNVIPKIKYLHKWMMLANSSCLPEISSPPPLFSMLFYTDLAHSLGSVTNGIVTVCVYSF